MSSQIEDGGSNHISGSVYPQSHQARGDVGGGIDAPDQGGSRSEKGGPVDTCNGRVDLPIRCSSEVAMRLNSQPDHPPSYPPTWTSM